MGNIFETLTSDQREIHSKRKPCRQFFCCLTNFSIAYYTNDTVDALESGQLIVGVWHLTRGDDICHNGEAEVLSGPLQSPA
ncbi:hypothetical protein F6G07_11160 [Salmonella enterica]|uniref:Uncharacterized protein n=2 Tax=Salmonella enterica TaxID=28901 RepID=A0A5Y2SH09_SALHO|nr:hypothetical protein [Salmonella enterica]ECF6075805.1 hypothetical protein [Salmonella enterica subsp. houtenae]EDO5296698.1 hypothetical protein [Salmonella enterica subsp. houtenae serovar 40:z4,z24:-]EDT6886457.1 hypothetical protein [Salmonella enterica subsp. enterica]HAE4732872.1 hypothetical protein [Salmonella enterica subsp. VII serovar 40:z4,z24:[z39]]